MDLTGWSKRTRQLVIKYGGLDACNYSHWEKYFDDTEQQYLAHLLRILTSEAFSLFRTYPLYDSDYNDKKLETARFIENVLGIYAHFKKLTGHLTYYMQNYTEQLGRMC